MDATGSKLLQRIRELLAARQVSRSDFGRAIKRGHSWISELFSETRTTNDLRLVIRIARFFGVTVGYLLGESESESEADAETVTLLAAWRALKDSPRDRRALLQTAVILSGLNGDGDGPTGDAPPDAPEGGGPRNTTAPTKPRGPKHRAR